MFTIIIIFFPYWWLSYNKLFYLSLINTLKLKKTESYSYERLSRGEGLLSHRYSAPSRRTSRVVGPSTMVHTHTSVCSGRLRCCRFSVRSVCLRGPLTLIFCCCRAFFLPLSLHPHSLTCLRRRLSTCTSTGTLLVFCRNFLSKSL